VDGIRVVGGASGGSLSLLHLVDGNRVPNGITSGWDQGAAGIKRERLEGPHCLCTLSEYFSPINCRVI